MFCSKCGKQVPADKSFCTNCGAPAPRDSEEPSGQDSAQTVTQPLSVPAGVPLAPQSPVGGPIRPKRTGVIVGSVVAAIVVLAGAGVGLWLGLRGDNHPDASSSTVQGSESTTPVGPGTTLGDPLSDYRAALLDLVGTLESFNDRISQLADRINATTPDVPQEVYDELQSMWDSVGQAAEVLSMTAPATVESYGEYLAQAAEHMQARISWTMQGIGAAWDSGHTSSATPYYRKGRVERDAYLAAMVEFYHSVPNSMLR